jgi:hypothetical protein
MLRTHHILSSFVNGMIGNAGFKFRYCHDDDDPTSKSVIILSGLIFRNMYT